MKSKYFLTLVRIQAAEPVLGWLPENLNVQGNIEDNFQGQGQGLTVQGRGRGQGLIAQGQGQDQGLGTQGEGQGLIV